MGKKRLVGGGIYLHWGATKLNRKKCKKVVQTVFLRYLQTI